MTRTFGFDVTVAQVVTVFRLPRAGVVREQRDGRASLLSHPAHAFLVHELRHFCSNSNVQQSCQSVKLQEHAHASVMLYGYISEAGLVR